jgi:signal transduction histidine kinase/ActR/RegA family two-component response regulator
VYLAGYQFFSDFPRAARGANGMIDFLSKLFDTSDFPPRWRCGIWTDGHGWLHIFSDLAIFGAYTAIPLVIAFFVIRRKQDVPFPRIFWLFVIFIFACGTTHLVEAIIFWQPVYRFAGLVKLLTAVASWLTVIALIKIVPQALHLPGLAALNAELKTEIEERKRTEQALRASEVERENLLDSERRARHTAEQANRRTDEFLSVVSHELRTPLSAILGYAQLLRNGMIEPNEMSEAYAVIERNGHAQVQIIDDLLDMSRIISGKLRLNVQSINPSEVIEAALETVKPAADAKEVKITKAFDPKVGVIVGDFDRLQQVVWNLVSNAVKFTPKGGRVQVSLEQVNSHLEIAVADTGCGISPDFLPHVFERFRQSEESTTRRHGGLGLGLSIVKQIVELHGGYVRAQSKGEGQGSTFVVSLPLQIAQVEAPNDRVLSGVGNGSSPILDLPSLKGLTILAVDDEQDIANVLRFYLQQRGAKVITAVSAIEALEALESQKPDVIISDIGMPGTDGYQLIRAIRARGPEQGGTIPAIALTAFARSEDRKKALLAGFQNHLSKPVNHEELLIVISMLTGRTNLDENQSKAAT